MQINLDNLPRDPARLHSLVHDMAALLEHRDGKIRQLQRMQLGRRSERLDPDQLALGLEDLGADIAAVEESHQTRHKPTSHSRPHRKPLPEYLAREDMLVDVATDACPGCGCALHPIGESVSEMLDWVPASLRVLRIRRPKYACRSCETVAQAPAPERAIAGGLASPALLAHVLVSKYADHIPLYRQSGILTRLGIDLERSTMAGWVVPAGGSTCCMSGLAIMSSRPTICSRMIHRFRCSILDAGERRPGDYGCMHVINADGQAPSRPRSSASMNLIARPNGPDRISSATAAPCMSMAMPGSSN